MTLNEFIETEIPIEQFVHKLVQIRKERTNVIPASDWEKIHKASLKHSQFLFHTYEQKLNEIQINLNKRVQSNELSKEKANDLKNNFQNIYDDKISILKKVNTYVLNEFRNYLLGMSKKPEHAKLVIVFFNKKKLFNKIMDNKNEYNFETCLKDFQLVYSFSKDVLK